jgi:hypothetical protein
MSCDNCNQTEIILPEGTKEAYTTFTNKLTEYYNLVCSVDWPIMREIKIAIDDKGDYVKARHLLENISQTLTVSLTNMKDLTPDLLVTIDNCLSLPAPKNVIQFNKYVKKTYKAPTTCTCAMCKYVVRADVTENQGDGEYVFTKFACNYENRLVDAYSSGEYTPDEIMEQLSVDAEGVCGCYEFGDVVESNSILETTIVENDTPVSTESRIN